jgi:hypothetical protein
VAGRKTTTSTGNLTLPIIFGPSLVAVHIVVSEIQALEIGQVFKKSSVLERNGTFGKFRHR